ncbi:MAG: sigma-54-dependent Fis family transcriptional regulator [Planctomycetes bacterium]|nr:sigma-54-dependent Fis family transcriptional regulator [Planctomycetota bacterium]
MLICPLDSKLLPNRVLVAARTRRPFQRAELELLASLSSTLTAVLFHGHAAERAGRRIEKLEALLEVSRQLALARDTQTLLERIATESTRLLDCDRASIFLWDRGNRQVVARPALGVPGGELRLPEDLGIVGVVLQSGQPAIVNDVRTDPRFGAAVDKQSGYQTRSLIALPLNDPSGQRIGVFEVLNKNHGQFTEEDRATLDLLAAHAAVAVENTIERESLIRTHAQFTSEASTRAQIIGASRAIEELRSTLTRIAATDLPVLILGESGTGKEVVARAIHYGGLRRDRPFIPVNCAAIAETLLESELFGHEKGAFTDARETRQGKFELASGGTLLLDEIGDMSAGGQAKLLRVLEEKVIYRVGGSQPIHTDVRIIAATNRNLADAVQAGKFRQDLFFRLTVVTINLPPLRERREDIMSLAEHFLEQFCRDARRPKLKISAEARKRLEAHEWPGNVRELRNLMERLAFLSPGPAIQPEDLAFILMTPSDSDRSGVPPGLALTEATDHFQREYIHAAIDRARGNQAEAARLLGLHRSNLYRKMRQLGMES